MYEAKQPKISVSRETFERLKAWSKEHGRPMAQLVELATRGVGDK